MMICGVWMSDLHSFSFSCYEISTLGRSLPGLFTQPINEEYNGTIGNVQASEAHWTGLLLAAGLDSEVNTWRF